MTMQFWNGLNAAVSAAIGGAALAVCQAINDPSHVDFKHLWPVAAGGAVLGIANHYRMPPTQAAQQALILQETPAGKLAEAHNEALGAVAAVIKADAAAVKSEAENPK